MIGAAMDRRRANSTIRSGILIFAFAVLMFALTFWAAVLYIG
jgi:hypothetical protein